MDQDVQLSLDAEVVLERGQKNIADVQRTAVGLHHERLRAVAESDNLLGELLDLDPRRR